MKFPIPGRSCLGGFYFHFIRPKGVWSVGCTLGGGERQSDAPSGGPEGPRGAREFWGQDKGESEFTNQKPN